MTYDVAILGGGSAGLFCGACLKHSKQIVMIEANERVGKKLEISGGGKCNITNKYMSSDFFDGDKELITKTLTKFSKDDLLHFLKQHNVALELKKGKYYFCKNSSKDVIKLLQNKTKHIDKMLSTKVLHASKENDTFCIKTDKTNIYAKNVIVATGGKSFSKLGATDIALKIAKDFGIKIKEFKPALVGWTLQKDEFWMKELSGISTKVSIKVDGKTFVDDMLFAHRGISGPSVLSASLYWQKGNVSIDFLPHKKICFKQTKKLISSILPLPKRLSKALLQALHVKDKPCDKLTKEDLQKLEKLHHYTFAPAGNFGFEKAEVSKGGVLCDEINHNTFESLHAKGLYFIGEAVDVTGELGGYNLQWAFSSAYVCAKNLP